MALLSEMFKAKNDVPKGQMTLKQWAEVPKRMADLAGKYVQLTDHSQNAVVIGKVASMGKRSIKFESVLYSSKQWMVMRDGVAVVKKVPLKLYAYDLKMKYTGVKIVPYVQARDMASRLKVVDAL